MKIYTKRGDLGETSVLGQATISKADPQVELLGAIDELNAYLGVCAAQFGPYELGPKLEQIQSKLFEVGAEVAATAEYSKRMQSVASSHVELLEGWIDEMTESLAPLENFILPGGSIAASHLHVARAICRRAERQMVACHQREPVREVLLQFINRLSDFLFVAARWANRRVEREDVIWTPSEDSK